MIIKCLLDKRVVVRVWGEGGCGGGGDGKQTDRQTEMGTERVRFS